MLGGGSIKVTYLLMLPCYLMVLHCAPAVPWEVTFDILYNGVLALVDKLIY